MPTDSTRSVRTSTSARLVKNKAASALNAADDNCGCVSDVGCCKDKGCCQQGKCPAEIGLEGGCAADDFSILVRNHQDVMQDYLAKNKQAVLDHFKAKGINVKNQNR
jgi:hypothetical protein